MTKTYFISGLTIPVPLMLMYFAGLVDRTPEDLHLEISERFDKEFLGWWSFVVCDVLEIFPMD